ncbi:MAG: hypothetical protein AB1659_06670 [Thermodesulfobacteriota bacterium]
MFILLFIGWYMPIQGHAYRGTDGLTSQAKIEKETFRQSEMIASHRSIREEDTIDYEIHIRKDRGSTYFLNLS